MTKIFFKHILLTSLAVSICCCSTKKDKKVESDDMHYPSSVYTFDTTGHANSKPENPNFNYSYKLEIPNDGVSPCADSIRMSIIASATGYKKRDLDEAKKAKLEDMIHVDEEEEAGFKEMFGSTETPWSFNCEASCSFEDEDVYCSMFKFSSYEGGAHGFYSTKYELWDKAKAQRIVFEDIFDENSVEKLSSMIVDTLCKMMNVKKPEDLTETGILDVKDIHPNNNISIDNESLTFNYTPYEIAAYAVGEIGVKFSFEDIKSLLKTDSPIYKIAE